MRVLVGCEFSGIVRDAFRRLGHDAWSCDLIPCESGGPHIQGDVRNILANDWKLAIFHPPCTYLSYAGIRHWNLPGRKEKRDAAMAFFLALYNAPIPKICVENPVGFPNSVFMKPNQIIEPYFFGDSHRKRTCLWLRGLPPLQHSDEPDWFCPSHEGPPDFIKRDSTGKKRYFTDTLKKAHERSRSFVGIANAMADQWSKL